MLEVIYNSGNNDQETPLYTYKITWNENIAVLKWINVVLKQNNQTNSTYKC